eukprot:COSAG01_NODE_10268_length_2205_cov_3.320513_2_plen_260_part_00
MTGETQQVTAADIKNGRIRVSRRFLRLFPASKEETLRLQFQAVQPQQTCHVIPEANFKDDGRRSLVISVGAQPIRSLVTSGLVLEGTPLDITAAGRSFVLSTQSASGPAAAKQTPQRPPNGSYGVLGRGAGHNLIESGNVAKRKMPVATSVPGPVKRKMTAATSRPSPPQHPRPTATIGVVDLVDGDLPSLVVSEAPAGQRQAAARSLSDRVRTLEEQVLGQVSSSPLVERVKHLERQLLETVNCGGLGQRIKVLEQAV